MGNQLSETIRQWYNNRTSCDWVLGTIYQTERSSYRKAGAHMLINGHGQQFGLLSGGCLEADIIRNARKVMMRGQPLTLIYDASDEDDIYYKLGIGCGGKVYIMLQAITAENDLGLSDLYQCLKERNTGLFHQRIAFNEGFFETVDHLHSHDVQRKDDWLITPVSPEPHLLIVGGALDAQPVAKIAKELGWMVSVADPRPAHGRKDQFLNADYLLNNKLSEMTTFIEQKKVNAVVMMTHNITLDSEALCALQSCSLDYAAMLGPKHRFKQVLEHANLKEENLNFNIASPAGLDIGGQLPESIALSILAQCHQTLYHKKQSFELHNAAE